MAFGELMLDDNPYPPEEISIRSELKPGDMGFVIHLHGRYYAQEHQYPVEFEAYVAKGLVEFYSNYDTAWDKVWICEHHETIVGFLLIMHTANAREAQLRYFILHPNIRGKGLGQQLLTQAIAFLRAANYSKCFLLTLPELTTALGLYLKNGFTFTRKEQSHDLKLSRYELIL